jgi:hypothetical protein
MTLGINNLLPRATALLLSAFLTAIAIQSDAQILAHGVTPANLGKGDWIHVMASAENRLGVSTTQDVLSYEAGMGMQWVAVKCADGGDTNTWSQFSPALVTQAHAAGLKIFGWGYVYGNPPTNVQAEINAALTCLDKGADGFIIDAEAEYEAAGQAAAAAQYCQGIRARYSNTFVAHMPFVEISGHANFPYAVFGYYCDAVMPQNYWDALGLTPAQMVSKMDAEWTNWQNALTGTNRNAIKPIIPVAQSYAPVTGADITAFVNGIKSDGNGATAGGYNGISFWDCQDRNADMDSAVRATVIGPAPPPPRVQGFSLLGHGLIQLSLNGQIGDTYAIESSGNLLNWTQVATFVNTNGYFQFTDSGITSNRAGFYRVKWVSH